MADTLTPDEMRKEFDKQIADLKREIGTLSKSLAARSSETYDRTREAAGQAYDQAKGQARGAVRQVREQAQTVADTMKENPGTAATVLSSAGLIGFILGCVVGVTMAGHDRRW
jgi:ElaB/YqjD/DUF883 family membrane-anchored ribosome-binding protein